MYNNAIGKYQKLSAINVCVYIYHTIPNCCVHCSRFIWSSNLESNYVIILSYGVQLHVQLYSDIIFLQLYTTPLPRTKYFAECAHHTELRLHGETRLHDNGFMRENEANLVEFRSVIKYNKPTKCVEYLLSYLARVLSRKFAIKKLFAKV